MAHITSSTYDIHVILDHHMTLTRDRLHIILYQYAGIIVECRPGCPATVITNTRSIGRHADKGLLLGMFCNLLSVLLT